MMKRDSRFESAALASLVFAFAISASAILAADDSLTDLKPLRAEVEKLVTKHYPKAEVTLKDESICFEFHTRKFMIHEPLLTGEWQDAIEDVGPQKGGIWGTLSLQRGKYIGMADVPRSFNKRYYTVRLLAPYSAKLDAHLYVRLKYPQDAPTEFLRDFEGLVERFDKEETTPIRPAPTETVKVDRQIPIAVTATVKTVGVERDGAIPVSVVITNGLEGSIEYSSFSLVPNAWNGETVHLALVDIRRDGQPQGLFVERPRVEAPVHVAGMTRHVIAPGKSTTIATDLRKWKIREGWKPGKYEITLRVEGLSTDDGHCVLSVHSDPLEFQIK